MINKVQNVWYFFDGRKTYIIVVATVLYALVVVGWQNGDWNTAFENILMALGLGGLRSGINKV